jgi:ectoine hydroxylase-related dioxygenase (phytanoyl-CoA dioxygenase family)
MDLPPITDDLDEACGHLREFGFCRIGDALDAAEVSEAKERLLRQAEGERALGIAHRDGLPQGTGGNAPGPNQRIANLVNKGEIFRRIVMKDLTRTMMTRVLGDGCLLSSFTANITGPGGQAMRLHTDQGYAPPDSPWPLVANMAFMLNDFTEENGATRVVPRSHLSGRRPDPDARSVAGTGPAGTVLVFDGRTWHGTGANTTRDGHRLGLLAYHCRGFVRQQENFALSLAPEVYERAPDDLLRVLGFSVFGSLGGVRAAGHGTRGAVVRRPTRFVTELG